MLALYLDKNENPLGASPEVYKIIRMNLNKISSYPAQHGKDLIPSLSDFYKVQDHNIIIGNGLDEIISLICQTFLEADDKVLLTSTTFPGYQNSIDGSRVKTIISSLFNYKIDVAELIKNIIKNPDMKIIFICNPHNPTGTFLNEEELLEIIKTCEKIKCLCVVDEAYSEFSEKPWVSALAFTERYNNLLVLRTFSKAYGLAGLRIGYALGDKSIIDRILITRKAIPFSVNNLAQTAAIAALNDQSFLNKTRTCNHISRQIFYQTCCENDIFFVPSVTNFVLIKSPYANFYSDLVKSNVYTSDTSRVGLLGHVRVSIGRIEHIKKLRKIFYHLTNEHSKYDRQINNIASKS